MEAVDRLSKTVGQHSNKTQVFLNNKKQHKIVSLNLPTENVLTYLNFSKSVDKWLIIFPDVVECFDQLLILSIWKCHFLSRNKIQDFTMRTSLAMDKNKN